MHNAAINCAGRFYLYDHDAHPEWDDKINPKNWALIRDGFAAATALNGDGAETYLAAAKEMATRIATAPVDRLRSLASTVRQATGLPINPVFVEALCDRTALMQEPQLTEPTKPPRYRAQPFTLQP